MKLLSDTIGKIKLFLFVYSVLLVCFITSGFMQVQAEIKNSEMNKYAQGFLIWLQANRDQVSGLPYSHVGDQRFRCWTITYDSAVASLAYMALGRMGQARRIIDYYMNAVGVWRLGGVIEAFVAATPIQGYDWSVRTGANTWLGIASIHLYLRTGDKQYLQFAQRIAELPLALQNQNQDNPNFGAVALGPKGSPNFAGDQCIGYDSRQPAFTEIYATEVSIDAYALFGLLYQATGNDKYAQAAGRCLHWLKEQGVNYKEQRLNRGYGDSIVATDVQSWGVSALGLELLDNFSKGLAEKMVQFVEDNCFVSIEYWPTDKKNKVLLKGVDFIGKQRARKLGREPIVSFEWSFQLVNAYLRLENDFRRLREDGKVMLYREKRVELLQSLLAAASEQKPGLAYPYASTPEAVIGHEYSTPKEGNFSTIGVAYAILALKGFDPLVVENK